MRQHKFDGAFYHFLVLVANRRYKQFRSHRAIPIREEFRLNLCRLVLTPFLSALRAVQWRRFRLTGSPYLFVPMQLEHDSNLQGDSPFSRNAEFVECVVAEFARTAPPHHHLLFKTHPLEDGRARNRRAIRAAADRHGIAGRVQYFRGGKLAEMLAQARAVITVNSTAAQQALWRAIPVKALGRAVYCKPGLMSDRPLADFLRESQRPDTVAYQVFRDYLLQTSQVPGGFYARRSCAHALRLVADLMLAADDPYRRWPPDDSSGARRSANLRTRLHEDMASTRICG